MRLWFVGKLEDGGQVYKCSIVMQVPDVKLTESDTSSPEGYGGCPRELDVISGLLAMRGRRGCNERGCLCSEGRHLAIIGNTERTRK